MPRQKALRLTGPFFGLTPPHTQDNPRINAGLKTTLNNPQHKVGGFRKSNRRIKIRVLNLQKWRVEFLGFWADGVDECAEFFDGAFN